MKRSERLAKEGKREDEKMNTYSATVQHDNGTGELISTTANDYTEAYLNILYIIPKKSIIINLKEI